MTCTTVHTQDISRNPKIYKAPYLTESGKCSGQDRIWKTYKIEIQLKKKFYVSSKTFAELLMPIISQTGNLQLKVLLCIKIFALNCDYMKIMLIKWSCNYLIWVSPKIYILTWKFNCIPDSDVLEINLKINLNPYRGTSQHQREEFWDVQK